MLRRYGLKLGRGVAIYGGCTFGDRDISIGDLSFLNRECLLDNTGPIRIGARCRIGPRTMLLTSDHELGPTEERAGPLGAGAVTIGDGCWLGAGVVVLPGVTIGDGCVIAAAALVNRDCAPNGVYAGVPARRLRDL